MFPFAVPLLDASGALAARPEIQAVQTDRAPRIDGRLDEQEWKRAPAAARFVRKTPTEGTAPSDPTITRVLYDKQALYVGIHARQRSSPLTLRLALRDRVPEADWVSVSIDTRRDRKTAFELTVNAAGVLADGVHFDDTDYSSTWDENWEARTARTEDGWSAELRIPLRILRFSDSPEQQWGFQVRRYVSQRQEISEWAYIPRGTAGEVSRYGTLKGLEGLKPQQPLELKPFVLGRFRHRDPSSDRLASGNDLKLSAGLDLKWHPTQDLTLDAAVLPDFGQVEADQVVLNLSNFETWLPEKRPFFLEGTDAFATPMSLLYTRRIGAAPASPSLRPGERLVDLPEPGSILGAVKLTGNLAKGWTVGTLTALTSRNDVHVQLADGTRVSRAVSPTTAQGVLRLKRDFGSRAHVGMTVTSTTRSERTADYPAIADVSGAATNQRLCATGDTLRAGSRCTHDAYVASVDGLWRSAGGAWVARGQGVASIMSGGPLREQRDGTRIGSGDAGGGVRLYAGKEGGRWVGDVSYDLAGRKLDYNDLGYLDRQNQMTLRAGAGVRSYRPWFHTLETSTRLEAYARRNLDGLDLGQGVQLGSSWKLRNHWNVSASTHHRPAWFDDREVGDGTASKRSRATGVEASFTTDPRSPVVFRMSALAQALEGGSNLSADATLSLRPLPGLELDLIPQALRSSGERRFAGRGEEPGSYFFGRLDARNVGATLRGAFSFTPRLSLQSYAQLFFAKGNYSDFVRLDAPEGSKARVDSSQLAASVDAPSSNPNFSQAVLNLNLVLRWEYSLGSSMFLVYSRSQVPSIQLAPLQQAAFGFGALRNAPASDVVMLKLVHWWG